MKAQIHSNNQRTNQTSPNQKSTRQKGIPVEELVISYFSMGERIPDPKMGCLYVNLHSNFDSTNYQAHGIISHPAKIVLKNIIKMKKIRQEFGWGHFIYLFFILKGLWRISCILEENQVEKFKYNPKCF